MNSISTTKNKLFFKRFILSTTISISINGCTTNGVLRVGDEQKPSFFHRFKEKMGDNVKKHLSKNVVAALLSCSSQDLI